MAELSIINFLFFIILSVCIAEFAIQIVISDLSQWFKGLFFLNQPYSKKLSAILNPILWRKTLNYGWFFALPIMLVVRIHRFFSELLACPWCSSFWLMLFTNYFYLKLDIITSLLLAPMALVMVTILDRLHTNG